jgi:hypothetical protein
MFVGIADAGIPPRASVGKPEGKFGSPVGMIPPRIFVGNPGMPLRIPWGSPPGTPVGIPPGTAVGKPDGKRFGRPLVKGAKALSGSPLRALLRASGSMFSSKFFRALLS